MKSNTYKQDTLRNLYYRIFKCYTVYDYETTDGWMTDEDHLKKNGVVVEKSIVARKLVLNLTITP